MDAMKSILNTRSRIRINAPTTNFIPTRDGAVGRRESHAGERAWERRNGEFRRALRINSCSASYIDTTCTNSSKMSRNCLAPLPRANTTVKFRNHGIHARGGIYFGGDHAATRIH
jgi:hypothetical protein